MINGLPLPPPPLRGFLDRAAARVPPLAGRALAIVPPPVEARALEQALNRGLTAGIAVGDFDFLEGRTVSIRVTDANWSVTLTSDGGRLRVLDVPGAETCIAATALDFVGLAAGHVDPDTLFFQRRLRIDGNVALGLEVKNTLDRVERGTLPLPLRAALRVAGAWLARRERHAAGPRAQLSSTRSSPARPYQ